MTEYIKPDISLLRQSPTTKKITHDEYQQSLATLQQILESYGIRGKVTYMKRSPLVTNYSFHPCDGVRIADIRAISEDIARALATDTRITITPTLCDSEINIAIPNDELDMVHMGDPVFKCRLSKGRYFSWFLGIETNRSNIMGLGCICDMEHVLVVGCPETGKSSLLRSLVLSTVYSRTPSERKLVLIDTKSDTFIRCDKIPHLVMPVAQSVDDGVFALQFVQNEVRKRLNKMSDEPELVVVIDEVSDLGVKSHAALRYIAQFGARVDVHLVMATRYANGIPSDIKSYIPTRMVFRTYTQADSIESLRVPGAENLLDCGDMLMSVKERDLIRVNTVQTYITELTRVAYFFEHGCLTAEDKDLYKRAKECVINAEKPTITYLQRHLQIGYNKVCELMEWLEAEGIVSEPDENGKRYICDPEERIGVKPAENNTSETQKKE